MQRSKYLQFAKEFYKDAISIMEKKNHDYSKKEDAFSNFRLQGQVAGIATEKTFLVSMGIKLARLRELIEKPQNAHVEESLEDTLKDLCNYSCLLAGYLKESERKK